MTYLEDLWLKTLKKELVKQEKIIEEAKQKLLYDPSKSFFDCLLRLNKKSDINIKKGSLALEAKAWGIVMEEFDLVKYIDKYQNKQITAESHVYDIKNKLNYLERREK